MKQFRSFLLIVIFAFMLTGCSSYIDPNGGFHTGETLTPDELDRLSNQIFGEDKTEPPFDNVFYWTDSGSKVHLFSDCGHLKRSDDIRSGDENAIRSLEKAGMCSSCLKKAGKTEADFSFVGVDATTAATAGTEAMTTSYSVNYYTQFYWTEGGGKYHLYSDCGHIKGSPSVLSGNRSKLAEAEKDGPCSTCLKKADLTQDELIAMLK